MSSPPKSRKRGRYHHGNLPAALLEAALAMLESGDVDALTLREVARRVGVTHAAPYRHFKDKAALLSALAEEGFQRLRSALSDARRGVHHSERALSGSRAAYLDFARQQPALFRLMFTPERATDPSVCAAAERLLQDVEHALDGLDPGAAHHEHALCAWAEWHGLATLDTGGWLPPRSAPPPSALHRVLPMSAVGDGSRHDDHG
jgi:AcrR family transcriptional regulator